MYKHLIDKIVENGKKEDMKCLENIMIDLIDGLKIEDIEKYHKIEYKLYKLVYGEHLNEELSHKWVSSMKNKDGSVGGHWTLEQTNQYAGDINKYDFYAILNKIYSVYYNPKFDLSTYVDLAKDWFGEKDSSEGKALKYYMHFIK